MTIKIIGTGIGLPDKEVSNDELAALTGLDTSDEWIRTMTGIGYRRLCQTETLTDLSTTAARAALAEAELDGSQIDYLICSTVSPDTRTPSLACSVAERIKATCPAVDLNGACAGFIYAIDTAAALIAAGRAERILIVCSEKMSGLTDWTDRRTCVLFGDGSAACVVTAGNMLKYVHLQTQADSHVIRMDNGMGGNNPLARDQAPASFIHMEGQKVFKYAVNIIEAEVRRAFDVCDLTPESIDYYLLHQANLRIIDFAISRLKQPPEKFPTNIERFGNISSVSIPLLLHEMRQAGQVHPGDKFLLCAFGAGMTGGSAVLEWE
ncbi:MAG: ketoacyl-ACP synthase III [Propionibacteriaceae bacterium]|nr:ketoacyl-ACP synthase III [Propionibacteriaceae bacterium]